MSPAREPMRHGTALYAYAPSDMTKTSPIPPDEPLASWIVPVYNGARYLQLALDSITRQTVTDFEAIVLDDGSTDGSLAIAQGVASTDRRFRIVEKANTGLIDTLNLGLSLARAPLCLRLDADDIARPERLQRQMAFMGQHPGCVAAGSRVTVIDEEGNVLRDTQGVKWQGPIAGGFPAGGMAICHPSVIYRTREVLTAGGYRPAYEAAEDYELWMRLSRYGAIEEMPERLIFYRVHAESVSAQKVVQQRTSCFRSDVAMYARRHGASPEQLYRIEAGKTVDEILDAAEHSCPDLPDKRLMHLYFEANLLRRLLYRGSSSAGRSLATQLVARLLQQIRFLHRGVHRKFVVIALKELGRYWLVASVGRNRARRHRA